MTIIRRCAFFTLVAALVAACATSPTGRKQLMLVSEQQAISASRQAYVEEIGKAKQAGKLVTDPRLLKRVEVITERRPVDVDWAGIEHAFRTQSGVPAPVSTPKASGVRPAATPAR